MSRFGVDWAWGNPSITSLKREGVTFACRYLSRDAGKNLCGVSPRPTVPPSKPNEARQLRAAGIDVVTVWETTANRALSGYLAGTADAREAQRQANVCGAPPNAPIYFAIDIDATEADQKAINAYFKGAGDILGVERVGVYGGLWPLKRLFDARLVAYGWQTYAWSGGKWDRRAQLQQYSNGHTIDGVSCDYNRAVAQDFGQWGAAAPKPSGNDPTKTWTKTTWQQVLQFLKNGRWKPGKG